MAQRILAIEVSGDSVRGALAERSWNSLTMLEALLRIEDRYEVKRAQSLEQVASGLDGWSADLALVDGVLVPRGRIEVLPMPTIVLSGNPHDGRRLAERFAQGRGWLRKDATAEEIRSEFTWRPYWQRWKPALDGSSPAVEKLALIGSFRLIPARLVRSSISRLTTCISS